MILEANHAVLNSLSRFYSRLLALNDFPETLRTENNEDIVNFENRLDNIGHEFQMHIARAKLLANIVNDRKGLVSSLSLQNSKRFWSINRIRSPSISEIKQPKEQKG
jgi:hypothetical protein